MNPSADAYLAAALVIGASFFGLVVQNALLSSRVKEVIHEVRPNSGMSLRDAVDRLESSNRGLHDGQAAIAAQATLIGDRQVEWQDSHLKMHLHDKGV
jgi:glutamine synthetase